MKYNFEVKYLPVEKYTTNANIYTLKVEKRDGKTWYVINGDTMYLSPDWSLQDAIEHYLSPEAEEERDEAFREAYGFYD